MTTRTRGTFFLAKQHGARTDFKGPDGAFRVVLRVLDRQGTHKVEPYEVTWTGPAAAEWWQQHQGIGPGTPLRLILMNPRSLLGRTGSPETHATVARCRLAPLAPSWQAAEKARQQHQVAAAA